MTKPELEISLDSLTLTTTEPNTTQTSTTTTNTTEGTTTTTTGHSIPTSTVTIPTDSQRTTPTDIPATPIEVDDDIPTIHAIGRYATTHEPLHINAQLYNWIIESVPIQEHEALFIFYRQNYFRLVQLHAILCAHD